MSIWFTEELHPYYRKGIRVKRILADEQTQYQHLQFIETEFFGNAMILDGIIQLTERDNMGYHEMITHIPALAVGGGFTFEDGIFKALALGAPFVKLVGMARAPIAAAMVGKTIGRAIENQSVPVYIERFGHSKDEIFVTASSLRKELGDEVFEKLPTGAIGLFTYYERLAQGLRQMMAGSRKFSLEHMSRDDLAALTREAADVSGIPFILDVDKTRIAEILDN